MALLLNHDGLFNKIAIHKKFGEKLNNLQIQNIKLDKANLTALDNSILSIASKSKEVFLETDAFFTILNGHRHYAFGISGYGLYSGEIFFEEGLLYTAFHAPEIKSTKEFIRALVYVGFLHEFALNFPTRWENKDGGCFLNVTRLFVEGLPIDYTPKLASISGDSYEGAKNYCVLSDRVSLESEFYDNVGKLNGVYSETIMRKRQRWLYNQERVNEIDERFFW